MSERNPELTYKGLYNDTGSTYANSVVILPPNHGAVLEAGIVDRIIENASPTLRYIDQVLVDGVDVVNEVFSMERFAIDVALPLAEPAPEEPLAGSELASDGATTVVDPDAPETSEETVTGENQETLPPSSAESSSSTEPTTETTTDVQVPIEPPSDKAEGADVAVDAKEGAIDPPSRAAVKTDKAEETTERPKPETRSRIPQE